jgi:hypothetical protein
MEWLLVAREADIHECDIPKVGGDATAFEISWRWRSLRYVFRERPALLVICLKGRTIDTRHDR